MMRKKLYFLIFFIGMSTYINAYALSHLIGISSNFYSDYSIQSLKYSYQQIFKSYHYNNFEISLHLSDHKMKLPFDLYYERGLFTKIGDNRFKNMKLFIDFGSKISSNQSDILLYLSSRVGAMSRLNSFLSHFIYIQYFYSADSYNNHFEMSYGLHWFNGFGLNNEFKTDRLKRKKRAILKFQ